MSTADTKGQKAKDVKTEQSQRVQQILSSSKTKEKRPKNLEQKIRLVKTSVAEGYADEDIERYLKESNYDEQTVINNILDGIAPRPGDSWSVVHNKMTKEERDAKKATTVQQQPTKPRGRGGRGGIEGQRSRGDGEDKKVARDSSRGRGKNQNQRGGSVGRGGRGAAASGKFTKENGVTDQLSSHLATSAAPAPAPTRPAIIPSGIITSSPNNPAPTVAQIVAGTFPHPTPAPPPTSGTTPASTPTPPSAAPSPTAAAVAIAQIPVIVSSTEVIPPPQPSLPQQPSPALPSQNEIQSSPEQSVTSQPSVLQTTQEPTEPPKHDSQASAAPKATQSKAAQLQTQTNPVNNNNNNSNNNYQRQERAERTGYTKKAQWKPKSSNEGSRPIASTIQPNTAVQPVAHSYQPSRGPVVLPGDFSSDIDDKSLNFTFGNFHIEEDKSQLEEPSQVQQPQPQPQQQLQQPQQSQPQQSQPQPPQTQPHQPQAQIQQIQPQVQPQQIHASQQHTQYQHSQHHHPQHTQQHAQQSDLKHQNKPHQSHQPHQPHHALQQTIPMTSGVLEQDHQQPLHAMHHMAEDLSQLYYMSPGPVMPFPMSHFPHPYEAETSGYYDTGYQQTSYRTDGSKYPMGRSTSPISSGNYRDAKFAGQDGSATTTQGSQTQPAGPGSPQTTQPHTFAPIQPPFSTMYPYYMGQFPQFSPANSPQYPFRVPVFKSPPYPNYGGGISSPAYPPTGAGYPEELPGQKYEAYMPPYTYMQPDAFMKQQQQQHPQQQQPQSQSQPTNQSVASGNGTKSQQFVTNGGGNSDLSSGNAGKSGQPDYTKYVANAGRPESSLYGPTGAPQYPMAYQRPYQ